MQFGNKNNLDQNLGDIFKMAVVNTYAQAWNAVGFLNNLIGALETCLTVPEEEIISQGDLGYEMLFVQKGDCFVTMTDERGSDAVAVSLLTSGDHFGEIALVYKCVRTATVKSRNYNSIARLSFSEWRNIICDTPKYLDYLKFHIYNYQDHRKIQVLKMIESVEYL